MPCRFENTIPNLFRSFDCGMDRIDHADKHQVLRLDETADLLQDSLSVWLAGHLQIEPVNVELEQIREKSCVVYIGGMRRIVVSARADMHPDLWPVLRGEALENLVVQSNEAAQQPTRRVELERQ